MIHAPSSCMDFYQGHPARERAQQVPRAVELAGGDRSVVLSNSSRGTGRSIRSISPMAARMMIPRSIANGRKNLRTWGAIRARPGSDRWSCSISTITTTSATMGPKSGAFSNRRESIRSCSSESTRTCACLGRPFGLRNMARYGKQVVLMRDMTDTMYNPEMPPVRQPLHRHRLDCCSHREIRLSHHYQ
jgi:hypothetical protein